MTNKEAKIIVLEAKQILIGYFTEYFNDSDYTIEDLQSMRPEYIMNANKYDKLLIPVMEFTMYYDSDIVYKCSASIGVDAKQLSISALLKILEAFEKDRERSK